MNENSMNEKSRAGNRVLAFMARVPLVFYILAGVFLLSLLLQTVAALSPAFADGVNGTVGAWVRFLLAKITGILPISVGELLLMMTPFLIGACIFIALRANRKTRIRLLAVLLGIITVFYSLFVLTLGCAYRTSPLDEKLGITRATVSASDLMATAVWLRGEVNALVPEISYRHHGFSIMPYTLEDMNAKLMTAYDKVTAQYPFIQSMDTRVKPVMGSEAMSYMHITGIYSYMTGEANINVVFPDYTLPFTAAHELAHQRGIAREDEANFIAYLVCISSADPYIRYSGYMNMLELVASALVQADRDAYAALCSGYRPAVAYEMIAYNEFYQKYQNSTVGNISSSVNNAYLQMQGTAGVRSYGMAVDLAVAYYKANA